VSGRNEAAPRDTASLESAPAKYDDSRSRLVVLLTLERRVWNSPSAANWCVHGVQN